MYVLSNYTYAYRRDSSRTFQGTQVHTRDDRINSAVVILKLGLEGLFRITAHYFGASRGDAMHANTYAWVQPRTHCSSLEVSYRTARRRYTVLFLLILSPIDLSTIAEAYPIIPSLRAHFDHSQSF